MNVISRGARFLRGIFKLLNPLRLLGQGRANQYLPDSTKGGGPRILIIAPGQMKIPVRGWGAVEEIVLEHKQLFTTLGYKVDVLNSSRLRDWLHAFSRRPRIVVCHYDVLAAASFFFAKFIGAFFVTVTHFAYASDPDRWSLEYKRVAGWVAKGDVFVALSPAIESAFSQRFPGLRVVQIHNFVRVKDFSFTELGNSGELVCVGKVEPRKRQIDLLSELDPAVKVSFVGPIVDERFESLDPKVKKMFLGEWSRGQLKERLSGFNALILMSDGEADALVLYEAQAAGLSVVVTPEALGSQDSRLDWIHVVELGSPDLSSIVSAAALENQAHRWAIRAHSEKTYDYSTGLQKWRGVFAGGRRRNRL